MNQPFTTQIPTICEMMPYYMRAEFFRRVAPSWPVQEKILNTRFCHIQPKESNDNRT